MVRAHAILAEAGSNEAATMVMLRAANLKLGVGWGMCSVYRHMQEREDGCMRGQL